tara:strand:- start:15 stop:215 length:201 start_codon:yes stop_codon:yes gene_type:complete
MKKEYILYGLKPNEPDYMESILYTSFNEKDMEKAKKIGLRKGYIKFRIAIFNGEPPNFNDPRLINL